MPVFFRYGLFMAFFLLSLRFVAVYLYHLPWVLTVLGIFGVLMLGLISWVRLRWVLIAFLVGIPLVSGLQAAGFIIPAPLLSFSFAAIYIAWFLRRVLWTKESLEPLSVIGEMADILAALVIISLVMSFQPYPVDFVLRRIGALSILGQGDLFWSIDASYVLLQGLFFYRILEIEMNGQKFRETVVSILYGQAAIIVLFSSLHLFFHIPDTFHYGTYGIFSPFGDAHSYGSYLVFLLFFFLSLIRTGNGRQKTMASILACCLVVFIAFSGSRMTWITVALIGVPFLLYVLGKWGRIVLVSGIVVPLILINLFPGALQRSDNGYLTRLSTVLVFKGYITRDLDENLSGRLLWWSRARNILAEEPATGIGIGAFYRVSPLYNSQLSHSRTQENAHNYYVQLATELGIPALLLFMGVLIFTFKAGFRALARSDSTGTGVVAGLLVGLGAYLFTLFTNHSLILSNQQFLFWSIIAFITTSYHASGGGGFWHVPRLYTHLLLGLLIVITLVGYAHRITEGEDRPGINEYGFYEYDTAIGMGMRWTAKTSGVRVYGKTPVMRLTVYAAPQNIGPEGLLLTVYVDDQVLDRIRFTKPGKKNLHYYLPLLKGRMVAIRTQVDRTFNPYRLGLTGDLKKHREQGVAIGAVLFPEVMPAHDVGFFAGESWAGEKEQNASGMRSDRFRWTGMRASMNVQRKFRKGGTLFLMCAHPDIDKDPVIVEITCDGALLRRETFTDHRWKEVVIKAEEVEGADALTFRVSRTWNPKSEGVSDDTRDLGVAVRGVGP
ncbi:MAG: O-antigen ligase family protein [Syntrophaceae bacterium]|nr:O-antigen ligase family protein [Syntrophaceae bacterium]